MSIVASPSLTVIDRFHCCYSITFLCMPSVMNGTWHTKRKFDMYGTQVAQKNSTTMPGLRSESLSSRRGVSKVAIAEIVKGVQ